MNLTIARFTLELVSPMHIGSGVQHPTTNAPVVRDAFGDYRIPGSSIAGALRAATGAAAEAWGDTHNEHSASMIEVSDGYLVDFDGRTALPKRLANEVVDYCVLPEIQDHVRIGHRTGAAEEDGKFDGEIIPQGTRFRCELALAERPAASETNCAAAREAFWRSLALLRSGNLLLGGDVCSGLGVVRILADSLSIGSHDLGTVDGVTAARNRTWNIDEGAGAHQGTNELGAVKSVPAVTEDGISGNIRLRFQSDGPLLVGGSQRPSNKGGTDKNHGADLVFGESLVADYGAKKLSPRPWIPGSSLRGAIRHRTWHVLEALGLSTTDAKMQIDELFGSVDGGIAHASKVRIHGCFLDDEPRTAIQHVAIDRLTGGSLAGALFSEAPIWKDDLSVEISVTFDRVKDGHAAVLAHALIDMANGELPIGGGTRRGNGRLLIADAKPNTGWRGKDVSFEIHRAGAVFTNQSGNGDLERLIDQLEDANAAISGGNS